MIDDIDEDYEEDTMMEKGPNIKWYLIDTDKSFNKFWDLLTTLVVIYTLCIAPFVVVFPDVYEICDDDGANCEYHDHLRNIEFCFDIIFCFEIFFNFLKRTRTHRELKSIAIKYIYSYFVFDVVSTIPCLVLSEPVQYFWLKFFRLAHL